MRILNVHSRKKMCFGTFSQAFLILYALFLLFLVLPKQMCSVGKVEHKILKRSICLRKIELHVKKIGKGNKF